MTGPASARHAMSEEALRRALPCPFCGTGGIAFREGSTYRWLYIECTGCNAMMECGKRDRTKTCDAPINADGAVEQWNRRAALSEGQAPEPVAQEPVAWAILDANGKPRCYFPTAERCQRAQLASPRSYAGTITPLYAGMDTARAKAIEECAQVCDAMAETISPVRAKQCAAAIRALTTKGAEK